MLDEAKSQRIQLKDNLRGGRRASKLGPPSPSGFYQRKPTSPMVFSTLPSKSHVDGKDSKQSGVQPKRFSSQEGHQSGFSKKDTKKRIENHRKKLAFKKNLLLGSI